ncbi:hypothetical protein BDZ94DRAFT_1250217 [Collybia nuda]|uniref:GIT Spa2 homology (SHD) domain-containing protein n=1 Tax=Collybia nuda TaxID=64659 RepID=A0A9P6CM54_9AGAR|nr:hypothetical protein BDZ94DRAFT_1250217 [Collybia nuda]
MATIPIESSPAQASASSTTTASLGLTLGKTDYTGEFKAHFQAFSSFLVDYLPDKTFSHRSHARHKLLRLTRVQFLELSTDVYAEVCRRVNEPGVKYLPANPYFHEKRNVARKKLSTITDPRMQDLCGDVRHELIRRYPEFDTSGIHMLHVSFDAPFPK